MTRFIKQFLIDTDSHGAVFRAFSAELLETLKQEKSPEKPKRRPRRRTLTQEPRITLQ